MLLVGRLCRLCPGHKSSVWARRWEEAAKAAHFPPGYNGSVYVFPQVVTAQESKLAEQQQLSSELQGTDSQLRAEVLSGRCHVQKQQRAREAIQGHAETLQHRELQTRAALECIAGRVSAASFASDSCLPPGGRFSHCGQRT